MRIRASRLVVSLTSVARSRAKPGYETAAASNPRTSTPSFDASPAIAPSIASRWSPAASSVPPRTPLAPSTAKPSAVASIATPRAASPATTVAIRSDSLCRSSPAPRTSVLPSAKAPSSPTSGSSSIRSGTSAPSTTVPTSRACDTVRSATGSPRSTGPSSSSMLAPILCMTAMIPVRVGLTPTARSLTRDPGTSVAATTKKAAEDRSPGTET